MMEHGKLSYKQDDEDFAVISGFNDGGCNKLYLPIKTAQRIHLYWNSHDSLKAKANLCDELVELLKETWEFLLVPATHHGGQTCIISASCMKKHRDKIEQVLAKVERIEANRSAPIKTKRWRK